MPHSPYPVTSDFGPRQLGDGFHDGVDLNTPQGRILCAPFDGVVYHGTDPLYGRYWRMEHANGVVTRAAHLFAWLVPNGARVKAGTPVARSGGKPGTSGAGNSTGDHVHYEWEKDGVKRDPMERGRLGSLFHPAQPDDDEEVDVTDAQAKQLADIHYTLTNIAGVQGGKVPLHVWAAQVNQALRDLAAGQG